RAADATGHRGAAPVALLAACHRPRAAPCQGAPAPHARRAGTRADGGATDMTAFLGHQRAGWAANRPGWQRVTIMARKPEHGKLRQLPLNHA
ncbi:hypothetical protein, partial [Gluconacetobacter diazotrophicus]|uniref:hypothetical protein n=1 Tax=Gluconacetobacter diazotrophicus TaxID=33996 RepID=UPI001C81A294